MEPSGLAGPVKAGVREEAGRWHHHNGYSRPRRASWKAGSVTGQGGLQLEFCYLAMMLNGYSATYFILEQD